MKKILLLAFIIMVVLAIPSLCAAQKCQMVTGNSLLVFISPYDAYHWAMMSDKETSSNYINRLNDTNQLRSLVKGTRVYTIDKRNFSAYSVNDFPMYQIADCTTKKSIGWIFGWDVKDNLKPCK
jgi:hypothetical protein